VTEFEVKSVVIACDAAADIPLAVGEAATLAARWGAALHGVYFEDENLNRIANLDVAVHVSFSSVANPQADAGLPLKEILQLYRAGMRRTLEDEAKRRGLPAWSFRSLRPSLPAGGLHEIDADVLIVEASARKILNGRRLSPWRATMINAQSTVLLKRRGGGRGVAVCVGGDAEAVERTIQAALAVISSSDDVAILCSDASAIKTAEVILTSVHRPLRITSFTAGTAMLMSRLRHLNPSLLVVGPGESDTGLLPLLAETDWNLLLVKW